MGGNKRRKSGKLYDRLVQERECVVVEMRGKGVYELMSRALIL